MTNEQWEKMRAEIVRAILAQKVPYNPNPAAYPDAGWQRTNHGEKRFNQGLTKAAIIVRSIKL